MTITIILAYTIVLFGTTFPTRTLKMDSPAACATAQASLLNGDLAKSIQENGGSMDVTCRIEVAP